MASTTFRGSTFSDAVSYALKQLQMSHVSLKPEQRCLWRPYMTGTMFSCGYLLAIATVRACVSKLYHSSWTSSGVS